ncbi:hypothetical protein PM082_004399 [Marasmius tenuissimus]|nr:hypothetical protein PM082_004399 [Marasmius tenuissimus]
MFLSRSILTSTFHDFCISTSCTTSGLLVTAVLSCTSSMHLSKTEIVRRSVSLLSAASWALLIASVMRGSLAAVTHGSTSYAGEHCCTGKIDRGLHREVLRRRRNWYWVLHKIFCKSSKRSHELFQFVFRIHSCGKLLLKDFWEWFLIHPIVQAQSDLP